MIKFWKKSQNSYDKIVIPTKVGISFLFFLTILPATTHALPDIPSFMDCADIIYNSGFQNDSQPSNGTGGSFPGSFTRTIFSQGQNRSYYISIPTNYDPQVATPLMIAWHGAGGAGTAPAAAQSMRNYWKPTADTNNFIVIAQAATGNSGGWVPSTDFPILSDILSDMDSRYNIEKTRIYGHGFSAGGHVMHTLMLFNSNEFAAYAVSAGVLEAHAGTSAPAGATRTVPVYVSVGTSDSLQSFVNSNHILFNNAGWIDNKTYWLDAFAGGHIIKPQLANESWEKLCIFSKLSP